MARHCNVKIDTPWYKINEESKKIIFGDNKNLSFFNSYNGWSYSENYNGVIGFLEKKLKKSDVWQREELGKYLNKFICEGAMELDLGMKH